uniref:Uncharacterized protein n=1 Tax=uncultured marine virus TaxID=186617 RepID=A0A0F7L819_9VIRU|nr:hypothetical protein [uncultured marine virus]
MAAPMRAPVVVLYAPPPRAANWIVASCRVLQIVDSAIGYLVRVLPRRAARSRARRAGPVRILSAARARKIAPANPPESGGPVRGPRRARGDANPVDVSRADATIARISGITE